MCSHSTLKLIEMQWSKTPEAIQSTKRLAKVMLNSFKLGSFKVIMQTRQAINMVIWSHGLLKRVGGSLKSSRALRAKPIGLSRNLEQIMLVSLSSCRNHWCLQHNSRQTDAKHPRGDILLTPLLQRHRTWRLAFLIFAAH